MRAEELTTPALLLDEMYHPTVAQQLRDKGFDAIAVVDTPALRANSDEYLFDWAERHKRWIVTENVKDFWRIRIKAQETGAPCASILLATSQTFPRSRDSLGRLVSALSRWLAEEHQLALGNEDWLRP